MSASHDSEEPQPQPKNSDIPVALSGGVRISKLQFPHLKTGDLGSAGLTGVFQGSFETVEAQGPCKLYRSVRGEGYFILKSQQGQLLQVGLQSPHAEGLEETPALRRTPSWSPSGGPLQLRSSDEGSFLPVLLFLEARGPNVRVLIQLLALSPPTPASLM